MEDLNEQKKDRKLEQNSTKRDSGNKLLFITIGVAIVLIIGIWLWKNNDVKNIRVAGESNYQELKVQAVKGIVTSKEEQLKLLAKPYVWAVRTEMMKGNISQVNLYALDMIKEKNMMQIMIINDSGMIVSSTNKKDEGKPFTSLGDPAALNQNDTRVTNANDSVLTATSPIMGFNKRIGTLIIKYAVQLPPLE